MALTQLGNPPPHGSSSSSRPYYFISSSSSQLGRPNATLNPKAGGA